MNLLIIADDEFACRRIPDCAADILISLGDIPDEVHVGFVAFNNYIKRARPKFFLHGHQHQQAECTVEGTHVIGVYGYRFMVMSE